jgi:hypothetical protein
MNGHERESAKPDPQSPKNDAAPLAGEAGVKANRLHPKYNRSRPEFVERMERIRTLPLKGRAERSILLAAVRWINSGGELWPSMSNWAEMAGVHTRTLQIALRKLVERGIVRVSVLSAGGRNRTTRYCIPALILTPMPGDEGGTDPECGGPTDMTRTPQPKSPNSGVAIAILRHPATRSFTKSPVNRTTTTADVVSRLPREWREHPNATRERLSWIAQAAFDAKNPIAWAIACIKERWNPPRPGTDDLAVVKRQERESLLREFDASPQSEQSAVIVRTRRAYPNLSNRSDGDQVFRAAIATSMRDSRGDGAPPQ